MNLQDKIKNYNSTKVLFCDFFDTIVHRKVHPLYVFKTWAKLLKRELGLSIDVGELFKIRTSAIRHLSSINKVKAPEIKYDDLIREVYSRLINNELINNTSYLDFKSKFEQADYLAEIYVQYLNIDVVNSLKALSSEGYKIYLVSDFHLSKQLVNKILIHHGILNIFQDTYISADFNKSKESGSFYKTLLELNNLKAEDVLMIGDNKKSDYLNAKKAGLHSIHLKHGKYKNTAKLKLFGDEEKDFVKACKKIEKDCRKSGHPFSEYIIHYYFFIERLYYTLKQKNIKDVFFLAREGKYLKQLFDEYQKISGFNEFDSINSHYLKVSRQSAMQFSFKSIDEEEFNHLKRNFGTMSLEQFLNSLNFSNECTKKISCQINIELNKPVKDFVTSNVMKALRKNEIFITEYNNNRKEQKEAFRKYLDSFGVDYNKDGMTLVDIGWGGTMQDCIYEFFEQKNSIEGYYLGLRQIYNIKSNSKRFGLNFSVYPKKEFSDDILMANTQIYEQLLAADHGSTVRYNKHSENMTVEYHESAEREVYLEFIKPIQEFMAIQFVGLAKSLQHLCYTEDNVQDYLTSLGLRLGIFTDKKKLKFIDGITRGFYQNIGNNTVGLTYNPKDVKASKKVLFKQFIIAPEKLFRYLVKIRPMLFTRNRLWLGWPIYFTYYYINLNKRFREVFLKKELLS